MHILLIANVSQSYFNQRLAAAQLQVANDTLQNYQQSYAFVEKQLLTGSTTVLALEQARGMIESTPRPISPNVRASWRRPITPCNCCSAAINICRTIAPAAPWTCKA
ncbi:copper/silver efflux system outer membrane protein CusC [Klebsiella pneumoniae]|uniref:Copper/silver efflux system outer membrane protein CusC n=1 Tax=Klebsiella pneumoniae TaxID=573 RepID=A0A3S4KH89_KLEPN|nr:copper/silver efflux system outer membrane protein CusC [Klebsiella pneumoniae]